MNPETYALKRDELKTLLKKTSSVLDDLLKTRADLHLPFIKQGKCNIDKTWKRLYEDQFKIALVARFQGGKSTTFNALTGGDIISPIGEGAIKCSASRISAYNVEKDEDVGVEVVWRSEEQLIKILCEALEKETGDLPEKWQKIRLDDPSDLAWIKQSQANLLKIWNDNPRALEGDQRDMLFTAALILHFYKHPTILSLQRRRFTLEEVGSLLTFPARFQIRYKGDASVFLPEEVAFPFIDQVICKVKSDSLRRIGATIIDCPGLYASRFDTRTAEETIENSDAVWYLTDGKALGESDLKAIERCRKLAKENLFFTVNLKADAIPTRKNIVDNVIPHQHDQLEKEGIKIHLKELRPYHALLSLLQVQGEKLLRGESLSQATENKLIGLSDALGEKGSSLQEAWVNISSQMLYNLKTGSHKEFNSLNPEGITTLKKENGFESVVSEVETYVVNSRGKSILIDNGAQKAIDILHDGVEKPLVKLEAVAAQSEAIAKEQDQLECKKLNDFNSYCANQLLKISDNGGGPGIDLKLAEDILDNVIQKQIFLIARKAAPRIQSEHSYFDAIFNPEKNQGICAQILRNEFEDALRYPLAAWAESCKNGSNHTYCRSLLNKTLEIKDAIDSEWEKLIEEVPSLAALPNPTVEKHVFADYNKIIENSGAAGAQLMSSQMVQNLAQGAMVAAGSMVLAFLIPGIGALFVLMMVSIWAIWKKFFSSTDSLINELSKDLDREINNHLNQNRSMVIHKLSEFTASLRQIMILGLKNPLDKQKEAFEANSAAAAEIFRMSQADKERIGQECAHIRQIQISPLRHDLEKFIKDCRQEE